MLCFLMYDIAMARALITSVQFAKKKNLTPDRICDSYTFSETYWKHEIDIIQDLIRQFERRSRDPMDTKLYALAQAGKPLHCPNVFITVTVNEWQFPFHSSIYARFKGKQMVDFQGPMTLDLYRKLVETMKGLLVSDNEFFDEVYEYCIRIEFQGRGTLHIHVVAWAILQPGVEIAGNVVKKRWSSFVRLLHETFKSNVDVAIGAYHNYISGYISKASDAMNFSTSEHFKAKVDDSWLVVFRLLNKRSPCMPEIFVYFARHPHMVRSFRTDTIYAPGPTCLDDANNSMKLYAAYRATEDSLSPCKSIAFIDYARTRQVVNGAVKLRPTTGGGHNTGKSTTAVGVRFGYEMHDQYIFHFCAMFFPHYHREAFMSTEFSLNFTMCFLGFCGILRLYHLGTKMTKCTVKLFRTLLIATVI